MWPWIIDSLQEHGLGWFTWFVPTAGVLYGLTMIVIVLLFLRRSTNIGLPIPRALSVCIAGVIGVIVGGHLYYLLGTGTLAANGPITWITQEGAGSWGGYLGCMLGMAAYLRWQRTDVWPSLDVLGSVGALAAVVGRWGCLLFGCDFGRVTSVPWAVSYPPGSFAYSAHVASGALSPDAVQSLAVHPVPVCLSINGLIVFLLVSAIWRRWRNIPGVTIAAFWVLYGATRFFWEFLRDPAAGGATSGLSLPQWMALNAIVVGGAIALVASRRWRLGAVPAVQVG
jgi:phosphatidylglycerol---prolipoprotein diacylglyceryl transferase